MDSLTLQEILSQPETWKKVVQRAAQEKWELRPAGSPPGPLLFVGCGTSYYLAQSAAAGYTRISKCSSQALPSSEAFLLASAAAVSSAKVLAVAISRSGTTTETVWAASHLRRNLQVPVVAVTSGADSALAHESDWRIIIPEAQEKSVVMTRSFTSQLLALYLAAAAAARERALIDQLAALPEHAARLLNDAAPMARAVGADASLDHLVFLGQGIFYGAANEAMLKTKEMSLSFSEAYHTLEYRHGPMSIAGAGTLITFLVSDAGREQELRVLADMKKLGARTLVLCDVADDQIRRHADHLLALGVGLPEEARLLLSMPLLQLLAYHRAVGKNLNPDAPRHLSQVVTL
ncbi:MAG: Glutamine--fructose-6-phosphate aminotransferase [isomerizing] [bacterium]|nr:Glutamine--fructose-6-phosphate aminotransferase [isomerizing] [bacterium]